MIDGIGATASVAADAARYQNHVPETDRGEADMSPMAREVMAEIGRLHADMEGTWPGGAGQRPGEVIGASDPGRTTGVEGPGGTAEPGPGGATDALVEQMGRSVEVQAQLTRFVMASSVSSSLGRNLNMFLRGQ